MKADWIPKVLRRYGMWIGVLALLAGLAPSTDPAADLVPLVIADHDWPPFLFAGKADAPKGLIKELLELCLPALGYDPQFRFYPINRAFAYLEEGKIDLNVMSYNEERAAYVVYATEPIFVSSYQPFVLASRQLQIGSLADLDRLRVGHLAGLRYSAEYHAYVEQRMADGTIETTPTQESLIRMLLADRIDVFVLPRESLAWRAQQMGVSDRIRAIDLDIRTAEYYLTVSRRSTAIDDKEGFLARVDACLRQAKASGSHAEILARYGIKPAAPIPATAAAGEEG